MDVTAKVEGDTVDVKVTIDSVDLRFARGDTSGDTAHTHVYVDRPPPTPGEEVPLGDPTIVHAPGDTVTVEGLEPGDHTLWVVLADGEDRAVAPPAPVSIDVTIGS